MILSIKRAGTEIATITIGEDTIFTKKLMSEHKIVAYAVTTAVLPIQIGDYIVHNTENYYINRVPVVDKINNFTYNYTITFEAEIYRLFDKKFMNNGAMDFSYHGTAQDLLGLIVAQVNTIDTGWTVGTVDTTDSQTLTFSNQSCRAALTAIAEAFSLEFKVIGKAISLKADVNTSSTLTFEYGKGKGLYKLNRNVVSDKNVITRLYGFGATKNINYNYRNGAKRLQFQTGTGYNYIESNVALYGVKEGVYQDDEIYPKRTSTITAVDGTDLFQCADSALDFDINAYLVEGVVAKIVFKTGDLAGYEFDINKYDAATKIIYFNAFTDANSYVLPNATNKVAIGDSYTLIDIAMPASYIATAELDLYNKTVAYLAENDHPKVIYDLAIDEKYIRANGIALDVATLVTVIDADLGINNAIRIAEIAYPLVNPDKVTAVISDTIPYTTQERIQIGVIDTKKVTKKVDRTRAENARLGAVNLRKLQQSVFDPDGYFDPTNIRPQSIETLMLSVGAKSQNFGLSAVSIKPNDGGDANKMVITAGNLIHYEIDITGLGYIWALPLATFTALVSATQYYVYAKCSKTTLTGAWEVFTTPQTTEAITGYYLFYVGILYPVASNRRYFDFTKGMTFIVGDTITSGKIQSLDGLNFFDLSNGTWQIGSGSGGSIDYGITATNRLTLDKVYVQEMIFATNAVITNLIVDTLKTATTGKRIEILKSLNNMILYNASNQEVMRVDDSIDTDSNGTALGGSKATNPANGRVSYMSGNGVFSNASMTKFLSVAAGYDTNASVVGLLFEVLAGSNVISAGVAGVNSIQDVKGLGGYFHDGVLIDGSTRGLEIMTQLIHKTKNITANYTILGDDIILSCYNTVSITITLPASPKIGRIIEIRRNNSSNVNIAGNGNQILQQIAVNLVSVGAGQGDKAIVIWDGSYWLYNYMVR